MTRSPTLPATATATATALALALALAGCGPSAEERAAQAAAAEAMRLAQREDAAVQAERLYEVAKAEQAALVPFFLAGVADGANPTALFQADRIHPNAAAQPRMLDNVWSELRRLLKP